MVAHHLKFTHYPNTMSLSKGVVTPPPPHHVLIILLCVQVEKFHKLWNFENCQYAVMEKQPGGFYRLVSELKCDP